LKAIPQIGISIAMGWEALSLQGRGRPCLQNRVYGGTGVLAPACAGSGRSSTKI